MILDKILIRYFILSKHLHCSSLWETYEDMTGVKISTGGPTVRLGNKSPASGKATVAVEVVMTEREQQEMLSRIVDGDADVENRDEIIAALGLASVEQSQ